MRTLRPALVVTLALLVLTTGVYPILVTVLARVLFPVQAEGSLVVVDGKVRGSRLLGDAFDKPEEHPEYFWPRPSSASVDKDTGVVVSGANNLGPASAALHDEVAPRVELLRKSGVEGPIPAELVTTSASGLDPDLSPEAALVQAPRVAKARGVAVADVEKLVRERVVDRTAGLFGEPRVNVLELNLALDASAAARPVHAGDDAAH